MDGNHCWQQLLTTWSRLLVKDFQDLFYSCSTEPTSPCNTCCLAKSLLATEWCKFATYLHGFSSSSIYIIRILWCGNMIQNTFAVITAQLYNHIFCETTFNVRSFRKPVPMCLWIWFMRSNFVILTLLPLGFSAFSDCQVLLSPSLSKATQHRLYFCTDRDHIAVSIPVLGSSKLQMYSPFTLYCCCHSSNSVESFSYCDLWHNLQVFRTTSASNT